MRLFTAAMISVAALATAPASAVEYPTQPIRIVVPYTPGTGMDNIARILGERLQPRLGQPVVVENRTGVAGHLGAEQVARAAPDGHTLLMTASNLTITATLYASPDFDAMTDLVPIGIAATGTASLAVNPSKGYKTLQDFIAAAKAKPGQMTFASAGVGSPSHLQLVQFQQEAGVKFMHVPYKGTAPGVNDLLGNHVDAMLVATHTLQPYVSAGRLQSLGVDSDKRSPVSPEVPSFAEMGLKNSFAAWYGLLAPKGTPPEIIAKLNKEIAEILMEPDVKARLEGTGLTIRPSTPEAMREWMQNEYATYKDIIQKNGITAN